MEGNYTPIADDAQAPPEEDDPQMEGNYTRDRREPRAAREEDDPQMEGNYTWFASLVSGMVGRR